MSVAHHAAEAGIKLGVEQAHKAAKKVADVLAPDDLPGVGELLELVNAGWLNEQQFARSMRLKNCYYSAEDGWRSPLPQAVKDSYGLLWRGVRWLSQPRASEDQLLVMLNRGIINEETWNNAMDAKGFADSKWKDYWKQLANEIPGPSDLVRFAVRHVFEPDLVKYFGYDSEINPSFEYWHAKQGMGYPLPEVVNNNVSSGPWTWAKAFWYAHWVLPSPTQGYEMLHRLRPTGGKNNGPRLPKYGVFTSKDLSLLLRANDYPPFWRDKLEGISFRPLGVRNLRALVQLKLITQAECAEFFLDQGYSRDDSDLQAALLAKQAGLIRKKGPAAALAKWATSALKLGLVSEDEALIAVHRGNIDNEQALIGFNLLAGADQLAEAKKDLDAVYIVEEGKIDKQIANGRAILANVKRRFLKALITADGVRRTLGQAGFQRDAVDQYLTAWQLEFDQPRKELAAAQVLKLLRYKLIATDEASRRLSNMGWGNADIQLLLIDVLREQTLDSLKQGAKDAADATRKINEIKRLKKEQDALRRQQVSDLSRHGTPAQLFRWAVDLVIDIPTYYRRMFALGWPDEDIQRQVKEITNTWAVKAGKVAQALGTAPAVPVKRPPISTLQKWLKKGIIDEATFAARAADSGAEPRDIDNYIAEASAGK